MPRAERYGVLGTDAEGIFFTEANISGAALLGRVVAKSNQQNMSLEKLKSKLAQQVLAKGGNTLVQFSYQQKGFGLLVLEHNAHSGGNRSARVS